MVKYQCRAVIHFAGLKSVAESVAQPLEYYDHNVVGTLRLVQAMNEAHVYNLVFSSSATVYGEPLTLPLKEDHRLLPSNPYDPHQNDDRGNAQRSSEHLKSFQDRDSALLQPGRRSRKRIDWRRPERRTKQPDAIHRTGRLGSATSFECVWKGLRNIRWNGGAGFCARDGSRKRSPSGTQMPRKTKSHQGETRDWPWHQRTRIRAGFLKGERQRYSCRFCTQASRRHRLLLRQPRPG
jgi:hypothetical protein